MVEENKNDASVPSSSGNDGYRLSPLDDEKQSCPRILLEWRFRSVFAASPIHL